MPTALSRKRVRLWNVLPCSPFDDESGCVFIDTKFSTKFYKIAAVLCVMLAHLCYLGFSELCASENSWDYGRRGVTRINPTDRSYDVVNGANGNSVMDRKKLSGMTVGDEFSDTANIFPHQYMDSVVLATVVGSPAFPFSVPVVIKMGSREQVLGVTTRRIVAVMANEPSFWNRSNSQLIGDSVDHFVSLGVSYLSVPLGISSSASPLPAIIFSSFIYATPKQFWKSHRVGTHVCILGDNLWSVHKN